MHKKRTSNRNYNPKSFEPPPLPLNYVRTKKISKNMYAYSCVSEPSTSFCFCKEKDRWTNFLLSDHIFFFLIALVVRIYREGVQNFEKDSEKDSEKAKTAN